MLLFVCHANICRSPMAERLARLALIPNLTSSTATRWTETPWTAATPAATTPARTTSDADTDTDTDTITIASAGTHARAGERMHPGAQRILRELGADTAGFSSRPLSADLVAQASLVLTATRDQRAFCVRLAPVALRRTFTIRQFGRLAAAVQEATIEAAAATTETAITQTAIARTALTQTAIADTVTAQTAAGHTAGAAPVAMLLQRVAEVRGRLQPVEPDEDDLADPVNGTESDMRACAHQIQVSLRPALALISV
jgi:protein-tyrosine phosphatase